MVLTELFPDGRAAIGRFGPGFMVLSKRPEGIYSHAIECADDMLLTRILLARAEARRCPETGLIYLQSFLGAVPVCLETTWQDTILVRVGYRRDYRESYRNYRPEKYPDPRIVLSWDEPKDP